MFKVTDPCMIWPGIIKNLDYEIVPPTNETANLLEFKF